MCDYYALCDNAPDGLVAHPVLGNVATCKRCADKHGLTLVTSPTVHSVTREAGTAGQYSYTARVQYPGEDVASVTFVGSTYGGPIVMVTSDGAQTFVSGAVLDRIGHTLNEAWVRAFLA